MLLDSSEGDSEILLARPELPLKLFCFPFAAGNSLMYRDWIKWVPEGVTVVPVELPGRLRRLSEPAHVSMSDVLAEFVPMICETTTPRNFGLFGISMGALIAFELVRSLMKAGHFPAYLGVASFPSPKMLPIHQPTHKLPDEKFIEMLRYVNGTPKEILEDSDAMRLFLPTIRADFTLCETYSYRPAPKLDLPITAMRGILDERVRGHHIRAWGQETSRYCEVREFGGGHFFLQKHAAEVANLAGERLKELAAKRSTD